MTAFFVSHEDMTRRNGSTGKGDTLNNIFYKKQNGLTVLKIYFKGITMVKYEEKFIVINKKHIEEYGLKLAEQPGMSKFYKDNPVSGNLINALIIFQVEYERITGKRLNQKYYVVNQDEPYSDNIIKIILDNENQKEKENAGN